MGNLSGSHCGQRTGKGNVFLLFPVLFFTRRGTLQMGLFAGALFAMKNKRGAS